MSSRETGGAHDVVARGGMCSSSHPLATAAGVQMLLRGGNAVDTALATGFALVVCEPAMSHLGGLGTALVFMQDDGQAIGLDFFSTAPARAHPEMFEWIPSPTQGGYRFWTRDDLNTTGGLSVGTPGLVAGWFYLYRSWASLPLATLLAPAVAYAREGVPMTRRMAVFSAEARERLAHFPATAALWLRPDGSPLQEGDVVVQADLARTLELIAAGGEDAFYRGEIADAIVRFVAEQGGILDRDDLAGYATDHFRVLEPTAVAYRGFRVMNTPPLSSAVLLPLMRLLEGFDLAGLEPLGPDKLHVLIESMKLAFADRLEHTSDDRFVEIPLVGLLSNGYIDERRRLIDAARAGRPPAGDPWAHQPGPRAVASTGRSDRGAPESCTTHHSHVDRWGNFVALTQTQGDAFGSALVVPGYGFLLNNAMKLYDPRPGFNNSIAPGKRPTTSPSPTLLLRHDRPVMALGSPSGTRILNAVAQVLVNVVDHRMGLQAAVDLPRVHWSGDELEVEADIPEATLAALRERGHEPQVRNAKSPWFGAVQAVARDPETGLCQGAADPRRQGAAAGVSLL